MMKNKYSNDSDSSNVTSPNTILLYSVILEIVKIYKTSIKSLRTVVTIIEQFVSTT